MSHSEVLDATKPADTSKEGLGAQKIRDGKKNLQERMEVDHNFESTSTDDATSTSDGTHKKVTLDNSTTVSSGVANAGVIHAEDVDSIAEVMYMDEDDNDIQITNGGDYAVPVRYAYASDATERTASYSLSWADDANMDLTITVKTDDIIIINFNGNARGSGAINTAVRITLESGSANTILASNEAENECIATTTVIYRSWSCQAIYQATADGDLVFRNQIKSVSSRASLTIRILNRVASAIVIGQV